MGYKVIFAPQAIDRLQRIVSHIARDNPDAALRFGMRLVDHAELLSRIGRVVPETSRRATTGVQAVFHLLPGLT